MSKGRDIDHDTIYALNPKKGTLLWQTDIPNRSQNSEHVALSVTATDKAVYVSQFNKGSPQKVEALSISNGNKVLWNTSVNMKIDSIGFPSTIVGNNVLYLYTSTTGVVALNVNNGTHLWEGSNVNRFQPLEDRLYVTHAKASDFCQLDPITGKSQWCQSPIATNNPIEAVSSQTTLYIASPTGVSALQKNNNGKVSWVYKDKTFGAARMWTYGLSLDY
jgi:outer membrane protein assembly factor BamB